MCKFISTRLFSLLLMCVTAVGIAYAAASDQRVTVNVENTTLKSLFKDIESQTTYRFSYRNALLDKRKDVTVHMTDVPVSSVLDEALKDRNISYEIVSANSIVISEKDATNGSKGATRTISGIVFDNAGDPAIGASVRVKGTTIGCSTDLEGRYTLANVPANATIVFSMIGCLTREIPASDTKALASVEMKENAEVLDEVVVVGYGTQKRANLTGAVATISADDINKRPVSSTLNAIQGVDPSVNLTFGSGVMDADYSLNIRGTTSVNGGSPLVLCDGMEVSLRQINPNDVESISILKDASASAIYGAKASSGVILITTKSGMDKGGKAEVSYSGRVGWRKNTTSTDFLTTGYDHVTTINRFYYNYQGKNAWLYDDDDLKLLEERRYDKTENPERPWTIERDGKLYFFANFDWYGYFFRRTRPEQEHNVSVTGGNDKVNYFVSGRFLQQDGIYNIYHDKYTNYSFRAKLNAKILPVLRYSVGFNFNYTNYKYAGYKNEERTYASLCNNIISTLLPKSPDGQTIQYVNQMNGNSPLGAGLGGSITDNRTRNSRGNKDFIISNQLDLDVFKDLVITAQYNYRYRSRLVTYRSMLFDYLDKSGVVKTFSSGMVNNYYEEQHGDLNRHSLNVYGTYNHTWNGVHNFKAVAGLQYDHQRDNTVGSRINDLLSDDLSSMSVGNGVATVSQSISAYKTLGYFARVNYDYDGKYLFEASGRYDGSSRFAPGSRWGFFPSASAGWRMSQENFWKGMQGWWNNAKLRVSYGSLGNQQVSNYAYFDVIKTDNKFTNEVTFDGENVALYATASTPVSSALTWEKVYTYNLGLDLGFFNNRLTATADVFIRDTKDMLTNAITLPSVFGASTPKQNCADLRTRGWELYLRWNDNVRLFGHRLGYGISATIGDYKSKITKYNNPDKKLGDHYVGETLGEIWGYQVAGLFATDEEAAEYQAKINDKAVNNRVYNSKGGENRLMAGDVKFIDRDNSGKIDEGGGTVDNPGDRVIIGNRLPRYNYSFRLDLDYFGFDVSAFFQGVGKCDWMPGSDSKDFFGYYDNASMAYVHKDFIGMCWSEDNPGGYFPRQRGYQTASSGALSVANDRYLQDASYLRLKNLTVGYTLPIKKNRWINSVRIYFSGENLHYWSPLKKYTKVVDPEMATATGTDTSRSGTGTPFTKSYSVGLDIKF